MREQELVQQEQPADLLFTVGTLLVQHQGQELRVECSEIHAENRRPLFTISYTNTISRGGSVGISKDVALAGLSESVRRCILHEVISLRNTSSREGSE